MHARTHTHTETHSWTHLHSYTHTQRHGDYWCVCMCMFVLVCACVTLCDRFRGENSGLASRKRLDEAQRHAEPQRAEPNPHLHRPPSPPGPWGHTALPGFCLRFRLFLHGHYRVGGGTEMLFQNSVTWSIAFVASERKRRTKGLGSRLVWSHASPNILPSQRMRNKGAFCTELHFILVWIGLNVFF